jgi:hypothetical protein
VGSVAVAGEDEKIGTIGNGHDFPLDPPGSFELRAGPGQALGGGPEELLSGRGGQLLQAGAGVAFRPAAAEQARVGAAGGAGDVGVGDVEQHDIGAFGGVAGGRVDAGRPGTFDDPGDHGHGHGQSASDDV